MIEDIEPEGKVFLYFWNECSCKVYYSVEQLTHCDLSFPSCWLLHASHEYPMTIDKRAILSYRHNVIITSPVAHWIWAVNSYIILIINMDGDILSKSEGAKELKSVLSWAQRWNSLKRRSLLTICAGKFNFTGKVEWCVNAYAFRVLYAGVAWQTQFSAGVLHFPILLENENLKAGHFYKFKLL